MTTAVRHQRATVQAHLDDVTPEQIARCRKFVDETFQRCYFVRSQRFDEVEYQVTWSPRFGFQCKCDSGKRGFANVKHPSGVCWHVRASVAAAREEREAQAEIEQEACYLDEEREQAMPEPEQDALTRYIQDVAVPEREAFQFYVRQLEAKLDEACNFIQQQALRLALLELQVSKASGQIDDLYESVQFHAHESEMGIYELERKLASLKPVAKRPTAKAHQPEPKPEIAEIRNDFGRLVGARIGEHQVQICGRGSGNCSCGKCTDTRPCPHVKQVDSWLETAQLVLK
jgi:hypothetical protein